MDEAAFEKEMAAQKQRSKAATLLKTDDWVILEEGGGRAFEGYDHTELPVRIVRYRKGTAGKKTFYQIVLNQTPFYPEGGGQVGDQGVLISPHDRLEIADTKKENGLIVHFCNQAPEHPEAAFSAIVDTQSRKRIAANHTATHLLHQALREVLGTHVAQKGSLLNAQYLRFDFSHVSKVTNAEITEIEEIVNRRIMSNLPLREHREIPIAEAEEMGAMMLFGEKYGDVVRAIQFGQSVELCGGTHVQQTGAIGLFKITSEGAVAAGIRRIEAATGEAAIFWVNQQLQELQEVKASLKGQNALAAIEKLKQENAGIQKKLASLQQEQAGAMGETLLKQTESLNGVRFVGQTLDLEAAPIKDLCFSLKQEPSLILLLGNRSGEKVTLSLMVSDDLVATGRFNAGQLIREISKEIKGGGGGQPFFATAGGADASGLDRAYQLLRKKLAAQN
jgi:alanyl-tRNA synthetase